MGLFSLTNLLIVTSFTREEPLKRTPEPTEMKGGFMVADSVIIQLDHVKQDRVKIIMNWLGRQIISEQFLTQS